MRINTLLSTSAGRLTGLAAALLMTFGCTGDPGADGPQGVIGPDGEVGPQGPQGPMGPLAELPADATGWDKLLYGLGGPDVLSGLTGYTIEASGMRYLTGESFSYHDPALNVDQFDITTHVDLANDALRIDWSRNMLFFGGLPLSYSEIVDGDLGYVEGDDHAFGTALSTTDMPSGRWAAVRKQTMLLNPHALVAMVAANPDMMSEAGAALHDGVIHELLEVQDDVYPITLWVNAATGRLTKLTTVENDPLHRDIPIEVLYSDWSSEIDGGLEFPMSVYMMVNGQVWHDEYRTAVTVNPTFGSEFDFPGGANPMYDEAAAMWGTRSHQFLQGFNSLGFPLNVEQLAVVPEMLEPGIYMIGGSSHNSMALELAGSVVIVEPPLYPERSEAILAWVQATFGGKPVSHVVITHHHHDHSAGFRAFVAAGAQLVVHETSAEMYTELAARPSTIVPDTQSMNPMPANLLTVPVAGFQILSNPADPYPGIAILPVPNSHAGDMVYMYALSDPAGQGYLFQSDIFNPDAMGGNALSPTVAQQFLDALATFGLNDPAFTLVGGHGSYAPLQQLFDYLTPAP